jgi:hypothetical protein
VRICLWIAEEDLRTWVMEELLLVTWTSPPSLVVAADPAAVDRDASLLVLGVDRLSPSDLDLVRSWSVPVIAIGADPGIPRAHVLGPKLTSRELKRALRAALTRETPKSAVL